MDTLYTGDIPSEYHYALFNNGYIDLYNTPNLTNGTYTYYRVYTNIKGFFYRVYQTTYSQYNNTYAQDINTSSNICYRFDYFNIISLTLLFLIIGIFFFNLLTSCVRKGGLLGGLL